MAISEFLASDLSLLLVHFFLTNDAVRWQLKPEHDGAMFTVVKTRMNLRNKKFIHILLVLC